MHILVGTHAYPRTEQCRAEQSGPEQNRTVQRSVARPTLEQKWLQAAQTLRFNGMLERPGGSPSSAKRSRAVNSRTTGDFVRQYSTVEHQVDARL